MPAEHPLAKKFAQALQEDNARKAERLILAGFPVGPGEFEHYPLIAAASWGKPKCVQVLLQHGAPVDAISGDGFTALSLAHKNEACVALLLKAGAKVSVKGAAHPLHCAATYSDTSPATWELLIGASHDVDLRSKQGYTPLLLASAKYGAYASVQALLAHGADVNAKTSKEGNFALMLACDQMDLPMMKLLVKHGADVHARNKKGTSLLHTALEMSNKDIVKWVLGLGIDPNLANSRGETPLLKALGHRNLEAARVLIKQGADISARTSNNIGMEQLLDHDGCETLTSLARKIQAQKEAQALEQDSPVAARPTKTPRL